MAKNRRSRGDYEIPDSREYVHDACGGVTVISGREFTRLASPFEMCTGTYCACCRKMVELRSVAWADTGEPISEYRRRHWNDSPPIQRPLALIIGAPLAGSILGLLSGLVFAPIKTRGMTVGAILGAIIPFMLVFPFGNRKDRGIDYRGER